MTTKGLVALVGLRFYERHGKSYREVNYEYYEPHQFSILQRQLDEFDRT